MAEPSSSVLQDFDQLFNKLKDLPDTARLSIVSRLQEKLTQVSSTETEQKNDGKPQEEAPPTEKSKDNNDETQEEDINDDAVLKSTPTKPTRFQTKNHARRKLSAVRTICKNPKSKTSIAKSVDRHGKKGSPRKTQQEAEPSEVEYVVKIESYGNEAFQGAESIATTGMSIDSNEPDISGLEIINELNVNPEIFFKKKRTRKKITVDDRTCPICTKTFGTPAYLRVHMRRHTGEKPYKCDRCDKKFAQKSSLWVHVKRHDGQYDHHCTICDYKSVLKVDLARHITKHSGSKVFICEQCGKMFTTDMRLRDHIRHVHERAEIHICDKCAFSTHRADNLRRHIAVKHGDDEYFKCPVCGDMIKQRATFIVHLRRHTGERPHICEECGKGFKSLSQLAVHRRTHKEGMHECPQCQRKFKTKHHLDRHIVVHTGVKPYSCMYCSYTCNVKGNINKHVKTVHKLLNFSFKKIQPPSTSPPAISNEEAAVARGAHATQDFLTRISMRKDEKLTVEALQKELPKPSVEVEEFPVIKPRGNGTSSSRKTRTLQSKMNSLVTHIQLNEQPMHCLTSDALIHDENKQIVSTEMGQITIPTSIPISSIECTYDSACNEVVDSEMVKVPTSSASSTDLLFLSVKEVLGEQAVTVPAKMNVLSDRMRDDQEVDSETQTIYLINI